ncbi:type II secretion system protein GspC [Halopseudomonas salegens]|uniref:Type II secretion system protein C (GspC) n=1 Tax=Halopseudomonas salegens TaxID=1434072 RepID=A0A1H2GBW8_9GAMM|nr:type II secretion system protein GspC [Halopseudomonas salegens]SDU17050.1 type II secretion system protein C (GspC) [Halopseudomonas salegens]
MPLAARIPLDTLLRFATLLLALVCALLLARLTWIVLEPSIMLPAYEPPTAASASAGERNRRSAGFAELARLSVFGQAAQSAGVVTIDAPDTSLNWVLKGVFADPDPARSAAILTTQGQSERLYRVGADLPGNVRLDQVLGDRVLLARDGVLETLRLQKRSEQRSGSRAGSSSAAPERMVDIPSEDMGGMPRIDREAWTSDPQRFLEVVSANPVMVDGEVYGLEVNPARNEREFTAAGLEPGDVIISVEGTPVAEINDYRDILQELGSSSSVALYLERNGEPLSLTISLD